MNNTLEIFRGIFKQLPALFLEQLDRNFSKVPVEREIYAVSLDYTFTDEDNIDSLQVSAASGNRVVYLPESPTGNRRRRVIKTDNTANTVTVNGNGNTINGAATVVLANQYALCEVEPTGEAWLRVDTFGR